MLISCLGIAALPLVYYGSVGKSLSLLSGLGLSVALCLCSLCIAACIGVPAGLVLVEWGSSPVAQRSSMRLLNILSAVPAFAFVLAALSLSSGSVAIICVLVLAYLVPATRVSFRAFTGLPAGLQQAAQAMGANHFQIIQYILLPAAQGKLIRGGLRLLGRMLLETSAIYLILLHSPNHLMHLPARILYSAELSNFATATLLLVPPSIFCFWLAEVLKDKTEN